MGGVFFIKWMHPLIKLLCPVTFVIAVLPSSSITALTVSAGTARAWRR